MKKARKEISAQFRIVLWETYIGPGGLYEMPCPVCGINTIHRTRQKGFEVAHIVPYKVRNLTGQRPVKLRNEYIDI